jgi:hypothetical protein
MTNNLTLFFLVTIAAYSCRQGGNVTYDYSSLKIDTQKIAIFEWDTTLRVFPKFSEPLTLTGNDVRLVDSLLIDAVSLFNKTYRQGLYESFNKQVSIDSFTIDLSKYTRQYFPYRNNNGKRIIELTCFSGAFPAWRRKIYPSGFYGVISKFTLRVNLSDRKAGEFSLGAIGG